MPKSKIFEAIFPNGTTLMVEGKDIESALKDHFYPNGELYFAILHDFREISYSLPMITNDCMEFIDSCS